MDPHPQDREERWERLRQEEVRWFYTGLLVFGSLFLFIFHLATGVPWWRSLLLNTPEYPFTWGRFLARLLAVPGAAVVGAYHLSDARSWWAPLAWVLGCLSFVVLLFLGMGVNFLQW